MADLLPYLKREGIFTSLNHVASGVNGQITASHVASLMPWIDALENAAMILTGMGPVDKPDTVAGKLFATFYALYCGLAFLTMMAVVVAPIYHRFLHHFHLTEAMAEEAGVES